MHLDLDRFFQQFPVHLGSQVPPKCHPKSNKNMTQKRFPKNKRKMYRFTSQNDASNLEKYSKTIGVLFKITLLAYAQQCWKSDPKTLILESFLVPKSTQECEKVVLTSVRKAKRFLYIFLSDFCSILEPTGHLKSDKFSWKSAPGVAFAVSWRQEGAQSAPRQYQTLIFHEFGTILDQLFWVFSIYFTLFVT